MSSRSCCAATMMRAAACWRADVPHIVLGEEGEKRALGVVLGQDHRSPADDCADGGVVLGNLDSLPAARLRRGTGLGLDAVEPPSPIAEGERNRIHLHEAQPVLQDLPD